MARKIPKLTEKDFKELEEEKRLNARQRMEFVDFYVKWLKRTPNKVWSKTHKKYLGKTPKMQAKVKRTISVKSKALSS